MSSIANPISSATGTTTPTTVSASQADPLASESTFLTLLVSQLQNQDPLDPVDSNQFVSQLTQYSQLEQMIDIHSDTTSISKALTSTATSAAAVTPAAATPSAVTPSAVTPSVDPQNALSATNISSNNLTTGAIN